MLGVARQVLGDNFGGHPVWNLRCKTPESLSGGQATVPWHQDTSYLAPSCWDRLQLTAWVPLVPTDVSNGCMQVLRGGHRTGVTAEHTCCVGGTWYTELVPSELPRLGIDDINRDLVSCELGPGDVLFLNNIVPHRSLPNTSDGVRWSLDLRWQRTGEPNGFEGVKDNLEMVRDGAVLRPIQWGAWASHDRQKAAVEALRADGGSRAQEARAAVDAAHAQGDGGDDELDTTIAGPWMAQWPLVHHNRHTQAFLDAQ